ncbi:hypothetical protein [Shimazuella kribbensis]|uniref:hypothetical protein n=1 Tax=Shimazuella kribbensis TaxID=139808 RepID=UPI00041535F6|nr:hypothetical protein [Shimazuella kribbensis]
MKPRIVFVFFLFCLLGFVAIGKGEVHASIPSDISLFSHDKTIFSNKGLFIPSQQKVDHIVEFGSDVTLSGSVHEIIVVGGNLHITKTAHVGELVLVIGGKITQEPGAKVTDEVFHLSFDNQLANNLLITSSFLFGWWFFRLSVSLLLLLLPIITALVAKKHYIDSIVTKIRLDFKQIMWVGIAVSLLLLGIVSLLFISVIGIPLLFIVAMIIALFSILSLTAISVMIGEQILLTRGREKWLTVAIGSTIFASAINFPLIGGILLVGFHWLSLGFMTIWLWEKRFLLVKPKNKTPKE